jgi:tetratricopeptide (TPR) repeat protein
MQSSPRIDELKQKFHENPRRYFAPLANEYRKAGDPEQAIAICRAHLAQQPGHMSGHVVYGQALYDAGRIDEAKVVFQQALSLDPENLIVLRHLGDIARRRGEDAEARSWYSRALDGDPQDAEVAAYLAELTEPLSVSAPPESAPEPPASVSQPEPERAMDADRQVEPEPEPEQEPEPEPVPEPVPEPQFEPQFVASLDDDFQVPEIEAIGDDETAADAPVSPEPATADDSMFDDFSFVEEAEVVAPVSPYADVPVGAETSEVAPARDESPYLEDVGPIDVGAEAAPAAAAEAVESTDEVELAEESAVADMEEEGSPVSAAPEAEPPREERASRFTPEFERTPIVTRTLAELYLQQGYIESALEIYRQLAEREPDDPSIRDRITELSSLGITQTSEWQEPSVTTEQPGESEPPVEPEAMLADDGDFDIGPMMPSEEPVAEAEVSELGASAELWDTADSWSTGLFEENEEAHDAFALSATEDVAEEPRSESVASAEFEMQEEPAPRSEPEVQPEPAAQADSESELETESAEYAVAGDRYPETESFAEEEAALVEPPGAKTPAAEVPPEEEAAEEPAPYADEPRRITIREFFATLGQMRPPTTETDEPAPYAAEEPVPDSAEVEEESYPYADDAFATLFENEPVNAEDSRAAAALSGAVAHAAPPSPLDAAREPGPLREPAAPTADNPPAKESEEDIRRFREWLEGLASS